MKAIWKGLAILLLLTVLAAPLAALWLNHTQTAQERRMIVPVLHESSKPTAVRAMLQNVKESVRIKGTFVPGSEAYQELTYKDPGAIRWIVSTGQEVQSGEVLGYYEGEEIVAQYTGMLRERDTYSEKPYLRYELFTPVLLLCKAAPEIAEKLRAAVELTAESFSVELISVSNVYNADGTVDVYFSVPESIFTQGDSLELTVYTGLELKFQMVLPVGCVYQKTEGEDAPWYVYQVTMTGEPIGEIEVELGYTDGQIVCVNQLETGTYYRRVK